MVHLKRSAQAMVFSANSATLWWINSYFRDAEHAGLDVVTPKE